MKLYYERKRKLSIYWKNQANDFYASAIVINDAIGNDSTQAIKEKLGNGYSLRAALPSVFAFICGTSLELNLKACLVEKLFQDQIVKIFDKTGKKKVSEDEVFLELEKEFFTHNLCDLAGKIDLDLSCKEKNFLKLLTHEIYWQARYPIPKDIKILEEYSTFVDDVIFEPKRQAHTTGLRARKFDSEMIINWENYEKIWLKVESFYHQLTS